MDIRSQLQEAHLGNSDEIKINYEIAKKMTLSDVCIIIDTIGEDCELILDTDITDHIQFIQTIGHKKTPVTKNFENMQIVLMLFIIHTKYVRIGRYFEYENVKIRFDCSEFLELAKHFGVKYNADTKRIVRALGGHRFKYNPESDVNIKNYLGLIKNPKSARSI